MLVRSLAALAAAFLVPLALAQTPAGLTALQSDAVLSSKDRNWTALGIRTWELRDLDRVQRDGQMEAWHVAYHSGDLNILGFLARPHVKWNKETGKPEEKFPAVILCHGSGQGVTQPYREVAMELARQGYVVAVSTYRGQRGIEGKSEGVRKFAEGEVLDVLQLAQLVRKLEYVDSMRMAIIGQGEGGAIAAQVIGRSNVFRGAVIISPYLFSGFPEYGYAGMRRLKAMSFEFFGRQLSDGELVRELRNRDAFRFAHQIRSPVLILAPQPYPGDDELNRWIDLLQSKQVQHQVMRYPGMVPDFMTAVDNGSRAGNWQAIRDNAWSNAFRWIEHYAPPNGAPEQEDPEQ